MTNARTRFKLDPVGSYYAHLRCKKFPISYSITTYLNEALDTDVLQCAVNDIAARIPTANVGLCRNFWGIYHELLPTPPQIKPASDYSNACTHFVGDGEHLLRVLYGENFFVLEVAHSVCDGRALSQILKALIVRYFELHPNHASAHINKSGIIDCKEPADPEESEIAWDRYLNAKNSGEARTTKAKDSDGSERTTKTKTAKRTYRIQRPEIDDPYVSTQIIDLSTLKPITKEHGVSINEYLLAQIFTAIAKERKEQSANKDGKLLPIVASIPVDVRSFFPSKTLLNFVVDKLVVMPEEQDFDGILQSIRKQFREVNEDFITEEVEWVTTGMKMLDYLPGALQSLAVKAMARGESHKATAMFSNLGLIELPPEVKNHVGMLEFIIGPDYNMPYCFTCITAGNVLTLTTTTSVADCAIAERLYEQINKV